MNFLIGLTSPRGNMDLKPPGSGSDPSMAIRIPNTEGRRKGTGSFWRKQII